MINFNQSKGLPYAIKEHKYKSLLIPEQLKFPSRCNNTTETENVKKSLYDIQRKAEKKTFTHGAVYQ